ncbi:acyloxyacyl hydrolase [Herminiimonas sp. CN]|uniref:acyloxyacyl hydrolase n=1 Tax=Herminiimonas sp. CN TaxID=1349818 RepID=UPI00047385C2|nr:acyloxyacyl hydrolase [Herminiimonas sp. CN]
MTAYLQQSAIKILFSSIVAIGMQTSSYAVDSASFEVATGNKTQIVRIGAQWNWADKWWQSNNSHIGGYWDLTLAQWRGTRYQNRPDATQNITDIGITPVFRFQHDSKTGPYAEAGIGAHLLSHAYDNNGRSFSTAFQFGDHIGIGYVFSNKLDLGLKVQHFSNGGIKHPNSGANFAVLSAKMIF